MRLRTFLVRRFIQTAITLVIVLVMIFVIFRLMPGDPTRFFIRPGQSAADVDELRVSLGFAKRVPAPGNGYQAYFATASQGTYEIAITANDTLGRSRLFYFHHVKQLSSVGPIAIVDARAANGDPPSAVEPLQGIAIRATLLNLPPGVENDVFAAELTITAGRVLVNASTVTAQNRSADFTWAPPNVGTFSLTVRFTDTNTSEAYPAGFAGVSANPVDPAPFRLVEERLLTGWVSTAFDRANVTINVTSTGSTIRGPIAHIRSPTGEIEEASMFHPSVVVRTNVLEEFWSYMSSMLVGDFGRSPYTQDTVWNAIATRVGPSLLLFGSAVIISYILGILIGTVLAWRRGSKMELSAIVVSLFFYSMPVFWFGLILLWGFAFSLDWFPLGGFSTAEAKAAGGFTYAASILHHMALPLLNLVILGLAGHVLLMRNSMLEVMGEDYITTAKAKGLSETRVMYRHAARNALLPVVTAFALSISGTISGGVLTETIFSWPGMGKFLVESTIAQDFPSVQGAFFLLALLTIIANLVADVLYAYLDPRVRL